MYEGNVRDLENKSRVLDKENVIRVSCNNGEGDIGVTWLHCYCYARHHS